MYFGGLGVGLSSTRKDHDPPYHRRYVVCLKTSLVFEHLVPGCRQLFLHRPGTPVQAQSSKLRHPAHHWTAQRLSLCCSAKKTNDRTVAVVSPACSEKL